MRASNPKCLKIAKKPDQITNFKEVTYDYKGDKHEPNQIEIAWGSVFQFDGKLKSLKIEYKLFNKKGEPLRADLDVSFVGSTDKKTEKQNKVNKSIISFTTENSSILNKHFSVYFAVTETLIGVYHIQSFI